MSFIAKKMEDGEKKGKMSFYCRVLEVSRQGFYEYLKNRDKEWKYQPLAEDEYNDTYGRVRMHKALCLRQPEGIEIPSERTVYRVMSVFLWTLP